MLITTLTTIPETNVGWCHHVSFQHQQSIFTAQSSHRATQFWTLHWADCTCHNGSCWSLIHLPCHHEHVAFWKFRLDQHAQFKPGHISQIKQNQKFIDPTVCKSDGPSPSGHQVPSKSSKPKGSRLLQEAPHQQKDPLQVNHPPCALGALRALGAGVMELEPWFQSASSGRRNQVRMPAVSSCHCAIHA